MQEKEIQAHKGFGAIITAILIILVSPLLFIIGVSGLSESPDAVNITETTAGIVLFVFWFIFIAGFFTLQPNTAAVMTLFGAYKGTVKKAGLFWTNPFYNKKKVSLRSRNLNGEKLKVNDEMGNPIEIAAVVVWRVDNTVQALFDVENYIDYVKTQGESALRHLAGLYPYDVTGEPDEISLRGSADEVSEALRTELQERLGKAGVVVEEARLSHLAYAPEIAAAMLQRQQASAIIAARQKIVEGAVGMVEMALDKLSENGVVTLDEERKAAMVSNLMVVLCGERSTQPVINTGTLHN